eukprot:10766344-Karenia_brevis.AAC.1
MMVIIISIGHAYWALRWFRPSRSDFLVWAFLRPCAFDVSCSLSCLSRGLSWAPLGSYVLSGALLGSTWLCWAI